MSATTASLYRRATAGVPLVVTVLVHILLFAVAGYFVTGRIIRENGPTFEGRPTSEPTAQRQRDHHIQVIRAGRVMPTASPLSVRRIISEASSALLLPPRPDIPQVGTSSLSSTAFTSSAAGVPGTGIDANTGVKSSGVAGSVFASSVLFAQQGANLSKIVFIVDVGPGLLDIRKGGFQAFFIIRDQITRLVRDLPPAAEFGVIFYDNLNWRPESVVAFDAKLMPATVQNKGAFFEWIRPVNEKPESVGLSSVPGRRIAWQPKDVSASGIDELLRPPAWTRCLQFALEMQPDVIFVIAGGTGEVRREATPAELALWKRQNEQQLAAMARDGLDVDAINQARNRFFSKARGELDEINRKLREQGKPPYIVTDTKRVFDADFQADLKRKGFRLALDTTGWEDKQGKPIWWTGYSNSKIVPFSELVAHVSKLKRVLTNGTVRLNYFLFVGPDEKPQDAMDNLSVLARKNNGRFELLTTKRLQELAARDTPAP